MEVKSVKSQKIFYHSEVTTLNDLEGVANREIDHLCKEAEKLGLKETGPIQFLYYGCDDKMDTRFTLEIALSVDTEKPYDGKYKFKELEEFTGTYYSPELTTSYTVIVKEGKLVGTHRKFNDFEIEVAKADVFLSNGDVLRIVRDEQNNVAGFKITTGRVRNLHFDKVK